MIYPNFIKENDYIGITSPSDEITKKKKIYRLNNAIKKHLFYQCRNSCLIKGLCFIFLISV